jgi:DNA-binding transcriptional regulator YiaG
VRNDRFEWDDRKAANNYQKHGIKFEVACEAFDDPHAVDEPDDEPRKYAGAEPPLHRKGCFWSSLPSGGAASASSRPEGHLAMNKISTAGKRYLKDDRWHDDNGPILNTPDYWDPPMTDAEVREAALSDPDCRPRDPNLPSRARRVARSEWPRHRLHMTREQFADAYRIPLETLIVWRRHEASSSAAERAYLAVIERDPEGVRAALAKEPVPAG